MPISSGWIADRALDLAGLATELGAPLVEHRRLRRKVRGRPERVPGVGVLGDEPERHLLAAAPDQDRDVALGRGSELTEPVDEQGERVAEVAQPVRRGLEVVAVLRVVALEPPRADAEHEPTVADQVDRARHVGEQLRVAVRVARDERAELGVVVSAAIAASSE